MITLQLDSVFLTFIIEKCSFWRQKVIEKCKKPAVSAFSSLSTLFAGRLDSPEGP